MIPDLTARLLEGWDSFFPKIPRPDDIQYMCLAGSVEGGTTTFLGFGPQLKKPLFALKVLRDRGGANRARNEMVVSNRLQEVGGRIADSVPQIILCEKLGGSWVLIQSILNGRPMGIRMSKRGVPSIQGSAYSFDLSSCWLNDLWAGTSTNQSRFTKPVLQYAIETIEQFRGSFDLTTQELDCLEAISEGMADALKSGVCVQHSDYCRQNILLTQTHAEAQIGVIDWTDSKLHGFPLYDLCYFLTSYFQQVSVGSGEEENSQYFYRTFYASDPYSELVIKCLTDFCDAISLSPANLNVLFGMFLIERAIFEYRRLLRVSNYGYYPNFNIALALKNNCDYSEAIKQQLFVTFFRVYASRQREGNSNPLTGLLTT
jgi:hypothetical protein